MWDGVHVLLKDRSEIGKFFIPDTKNSRKNGKLFFNFYIIINYYISFYKFNL